jgi:hypothetical protein
MCTIFISRSRITVALLATVSVLAVANSSADAKSFGLGGGMAHGGGGMAGGRPAMTHMPSGGGQMRSMTTREAPRVTARPAGMAEGIRRGPSVGNFPHAKPSSLSVDSRRDRTVHSDGPRTGKSDTPVGKPAAGVSTTASTDRKSNTTSARSDGNGTRAVTDGGGKVSSRDVIGKELPTKVDFTKPNQFGPPHTASTTFEGTRVTVQEPPRRRTIEQQQADDWDRGEFWKPPVYNPTGESSFMKGVREDKANAQTDIVNAEQERHNSTMPDGLWEQAHGDPIGHAQESIKRRNWMIEIYEEAYLHGIDLGLSNLASHAYAQIKLDEWRAKSLEDFEQTFGTHFAQLGQAISGDPLGNLQKMIAQGVPVVVVKTVSTTARTAAQELGTGTTARPTVPNGPPPPPPPPVASEGASILLANESIATNCSNVKPTPGWHNVFIHGNGTGFGFKLGGKTGVETIRVGVKTLKDAMIRTGYKGGPVVLNSCSTGSLAEGAAQQLADELGETVLAPTSSVGVTKSGRVVTMNGGQWNLFFPTLTPTR